MSFSSRFSCDFIESTDTNLEACHVDESLQRDIESVIGSIYRMNAPGAIGYLFNAKKGQRGIANGMFCGRGCEIDADHWDYFVDFSVSELAVFKLYKVG